jgi:hypothetical protein
VTDSQQATYAKIVPWLEENFDSVIRDDSAGRAEVHVGSAVVRVTVRPGPPGDDDSFITMRSWVVQRPRITTALCRYLLRENASLRFGKFGIDEDGDVTLDHTLLGSTVSHKEVKVVLHMLASLADDYDDRLMAQYGGKRAIDVMRDKQG